MLRNKPAVRQRAPACGLAPVKDETRSYLIKAKGALFTIWQVVRKRAFLFGKLNLNASRASASCQGLAATAGRPELSLHGTPSATCKQNGFIHDSAACLGDSSFSQTKTSYFLFPPLFPASSLYRSPNQKALAGEPVRAFCNQRMGITSWRGISSYPECRQPG